MAPHSRDDTAADPLVMTPPDSSPDSPPEPDSPTRSSRPDSSPSPYTLPSSSDPSPAGAGAGSAGSSSERRSSGSSRAELRRKLARLAERAVDIVGQGVHRALTRADSPERIEQVWLPDDQDVENISKPLGSIAARRVPASLADAEKFDLVELVAALVEYVTKNLADLRDVRERYGPPAEPDSVPGQVIEQHDHDPQPDPAEQPAPAPGVLHFGQRFLSGGTPTRPVPGSPT